jgi:hypothetical protein
LMLPCRFHAFQRTDCPLLPVLSIFTPALAFVCLLRLEICFFHRLQTGVALRLCPSTCTTPPNPSTCPSFPATAPAPISINFLILVGCNNGIGGFNENLEFFREQKLPDFNKLQRCSSKNAVLRFF